MSQLLAGTQRALEIVTAGWGGAFLALGLLLLFARDVLVDFFVDPPPVAVPPEVPVALPADPLPEPADRPGPDPPDVLPGGDAPPVIEAAVAPAGSASATAAANARNRNRLFARVLSMR
ncbi:MAG TPA: hypothetical protein VG147_03170 [Solirubrobacteraceae bacterium]|nr:hypothetical protein [Solirubrobacteraceae bacterium]